ncbi:MULTISPECIES: amidohydrolase family protein [unclassified Cupriavidus]|uniref:metal-dependent hydrolase family protein n=1 Tax=unclassified Cupriavidus TaxID=2640874 RepID=UPI001BFFF14E|nr:MULTISPECIES: amidohydrolase family protein [unclassified Cupriavidus]MCA3189729.1 amidohydrolase family protein [Cupriavidus sp.]MCA3196323.1 amidohydrolase family protein [Cupriavidus sp.]MCA3202068.1 amidohydrolase family protein [Cupriavidus sp.]MCA3207091.1 amidohydrolase family protein [Cupriavidus sp.]MCA3232289.1 amidohydrolase family protein [Cupriavidus sp.]
MTQILLQGGNVLDPVRGALLPRHDVLIDGERIVEVSATPIHAPHARVIDVTGKTVMPGLIDLHVHVLASLANLGVNAVQPNVLVAFRAMPIMRGMLERGFTTVRDAGGADWGLSQAVATGLIPGPRIFPSGKALSQTGGHGDFRPRSDTLEPCSCAFRAGAIARVVDGVDAVRLAVREEIQKGATQIKIMASGGVASPTDPIGNTQYSEDEIRAIVAEAEAAQTYVMAHAYTPRAITRAVRCGARTIEHGNLVDAAAARVMREHGAYVVPTLITYDALARDGERLGLPADSVAKIETVRQAGRDSLAIYAEAGVPMGFGSDLLGEMHQYQSEEFRIRADLLGNVEAVRSATSIAAEILQRDGELGVVKAGAIADVLVVDGNPLQDIEVLAGPASRIELVMQAGRIHGA